jgi:hypothetical protein
LIGLACAACGRVDFDDPMYDYCASLPSLAADPLIDGVLEPGLTTTSIAPLWSSEFGNLPIPPGVGARYALGWRPYRMYFFVEITTPKRWPATPAEHAYCGDAVELYVDDDGNYAAPPVYDDPGTRQLIVAAPDDASSSIARGEIYRSSSLLGPWTSTLFRAFSRPDGYAVEAVVVASDLGLASWSLAGRVGFDLSVDVSVPDGSSTNLPPCNVRYRVGQFHLRVTGSQPGCTDGGPYCDVAAFCNPALQ